MAGSNVQEVGTLPLLERSHHIVDARPLTVEPDARRIETHPLDARVPLETIAPESLAGSPNSLAFCAADAAEPRRPGAGAAGSDFDDQDHVALPRDDVELEPPELEVARHDGAAGALQVTGDRLFGALAQARAGGADGTRRRTPLRRALSAPGSSDPGSSAAGLIAAGSHH